jgi:pre-peptidase
MKPNRSSRLWVILLLLLTLIPASGMAQAQQNTFGLGASDYQLLSSANAAVAAAKSLQFTFNLALSGTGAASSSVSLNGTGGLDATNSASPLFQLAVNGSMTTGSQNTPLQAEIRVVNGVIYFSGVNPQTNQPIAWQGIALSDLQSFASSGALTSMLPVNPTTLTGGAGNQQALTGMMTALSQANLPQYIHMNRQADESGLAHFTVTVDTTGFAASPALSALVSSVAQMQATSGSATTVTPQQLQQAQVMLQGILSGTQLTVDQYIDTSANVMQRTVLNLAINMPASGSTPATSGSLMLDFSVSGINQPVAVTAPAGATMVNTSQLLSGMSSGLSGGLNTNPSNPNFAVPTATPGAQVSTGPAQPIPADTPTTVQLNGALDMVYNAPSAQTVTITARSLAPSPGIDTTVEVRNSDGISLASNDDHDSSFTGGNLSNTDSAIVNLNLPAAGAYTIHLSSFLGTDVGPVEITVATSAASGTGGSTGGTTGSVTTNGQSIAANSPTTVQLSTSGPTDLIYTSTAPEIVTVMARSLEPADALDPTVEVLDANGTSLASNDDHDPSFNPGNLGDRDSAITNLKLPTPGPYTIRVSSFSGSAAGRVEVTVQSGTAPGNGTGGTSGGSPGTTQDINDTVPANGAYTYNFNGNAGDLVTILVHSTDPNFDPKVALLNASGVVLIDNDDHDTGVSDPMLTQTDSAIASFSLPTSGAYTIQITGFAGSGGTFQMRLTTGGGGTGGGTTGGGTTGGGTTGGGNGPQSFNGSIASGGTYTQTVQLNAGDMVNITVDTSSGDLDPNVTLYDSQKNEVAFNDDRNAPLSDYNSTIPNFIVQTTGTYELDVAGYQQTSGSFTLAVTRVATGAPLGPGQDQVFSGKVEANGTSTQTVQFNAGDYVTITVRSLSQDFDTKISLLGPAGSELTSNDDYVPDDPNDSGMGSTDSRIRNFQVTQTGTYTIQVTGYQGSGGNYAMVVNVKH